MDNINTRQKGLLAEHLEGRISRAQLLKAAAAGAALAAMPAGAAAAGTGTASSLDFPFFPQVSSGSYTTESIQEIVSNMLTQQYLHLNAGFAVLATPGLATKLGLGSGPALTYFQSIVRVEQDQIDFWSSLVPGASPVTTTFTIDPALLASGPILLGAGEVVDTLRVATDLTAVREFSELGQPTLAKYAAQTLGVASEMRVSVRWLGTVAGVSTFSPALNKAFETDLLLYTGDGIAILRALGLIGGAGVKVAYPGRDKVLALVRALASDIIQTVPNNATSTVAVTGLASLTAGRS